MHVYRDCRSDTNMRMLLLAAQGNSILYTIQATVGKWLDPQILSLETIMHLFLAGRFRNLPQKGIA